jgi:hypothetical protein
VTVSKGRWPISAMMSLLGVGCGCGNTVDVVSIVPWGNAMPTMTVGDTVEFTLQGSSYSKVPSGYLCPPLYTSDTDPQRFAITLSDSSVVEVEHTRYIIAKNVGETTFRVNVGAVSSEEIVITVKP